MCMFFKSPSPYWCASQEQGSTLRSPLVDPFDQDVPSAQAPEKRQGLAKPSDSLQGGIEGPPLMDVVASTVRQRHQQNQQQGAGASSSGSRDQGEAGPSQTMSWPAERLGPMHEDSKAGVRLIDKLQEGRGSGSDDGAMSSAADRSQKQRKARLRQLASELKSFAASTAH